MKTFFKFWTYWSVIFVAMTFASFAVAGKDNDGVAGGLVVLSIFASGYLSFRLARNKKGPSEKYQKSNDSSDFGVKVSISANSYNRNDYYDKDYTNQELQDCTNSLLSHGKNSIQKNFEVTCLEESEDFKKIVNASFKHYVKNDLQGWDEAVNPKVLDYAILKYRPQVVELLNVAEKLSFVYESMLADLKSTDSFQNAGELDRASMLDEFEDKFIEDYVEKSFDEYRFNEQDFADIFIKTEFKDDFSILEKFGYELSKKIFDSCSYFFEKKSKVFNIASDAYRYKDIKSLADAGILTNGEDFEASELLELLKVSDIRELAKKKEVSIKGRKKEDLINNFLGQCKVSHADIGNYVALREVFGLSAEFNDFYDFNHNHLTWKKYKLISDYVVGRIEQVADAKFCEEKPRSSFNNKFLSKIIIKTAA